MIYEYFKVSDKDESVLDLNEILNVELKNDNTKSSNTRWGETIILMKKQSDEEIRVREAEATALCTFEILLDRVNRETTLDLVGGGPLPGAENS